MLRLLAVLAVPTLFLAIASAAPVPKGALDPLYFPTKVGARWVYQSGTGGTTTSVVTAVHEHEGASIVTVAQVMANGKLSDGIRIAVSARGLCDGYGALGGPWVPISWRLKMPPYVGHRWELVLPTGITYPPNTLPKVVSVVAGREWVEVPDGRYLTVRVETETARDDARGPYRRREWYAPGVGSVKFEDDEGRSGVLKSFTPGKE